MSLDTLTAEGAVVVARCEVWRDGVQVDEPIVVDGSVRYDATSLVTRTVDVELVGDLDDLSPSGSELRLFRGARDWTGELFEAPVGRYAFDASSIQRSKRTIRISGADYSTLVSDARWETPYLIEDGTALDVAISNLIESRLSVNLWQEPNLVSTSATVPATVLGEETDNDPMRDAIALARSDGLEVRFDRSGRLELFETPDPSTATAARWVYRAGVSPTYLGADREIEGRPYNVVVARGETEEDVAPVQATAEDDDPLSPSYIGRYRRPYFLVSPYIATEAQAFRAAVGELNRRIGLTEIVALSVVPHPELDVGQIIEAYDPELDVDARYLIDSVELPLLPGEATLTTRRRRIS